MHPWSGCICRTFQGEDIDANLSASYNLDCNITFLSEDKIIVVLTVHLLYASINDAYKNKDYIIHIYLCRFMACRVWSIYYVTEQIGDHIILLYNWLPIYILILSVYNGYD